jgi:hypothetical protein
MRILAALMLSMMLLSTALLTRAVVNHDQQPPRPASLADRVRDDHGRQPVVFPGP